MHTMTLGVFRRDGKLYYRLRFAGQEVEREAPKDAKGFIMIKAPSREAAKILDNALNILLREVEREDPDAQGVRICGDWSDAT